MIAYPKRELEVVIECDDDENNPTCWAMKSEFDYGGNRYHYVWIIKYGEKEYIVENSGGYNLVGNQVFKTLWGAKRAAEGIIWRQDESGCYSD